VDRDDRAVAGAVPGGGGRGRFDQGQGAVHEHGGHDVGHHLGRVVGGVHGVADHEAGDEVGVATQHHRVDGLEPLDEDRLDGGADPQRDGAAVLQDQREQRLGFGADDAVEERMLPGDAQHREDARLQRPSGIGGQVSHHHGLHHAVGLAGHGRGHQVLLGPEVLVERGARHPGPLGHVADGEPRDAVDGGRLDPRLEDPVPCPRLGHGRQVNNLRQLVNVTPGAASTDRGEAVVGNRREPGQAVAAPARTWSRISTMRAMSASANSASGPWGLRSVKGDS
jgi:hypothetical protein